MRGRLDRRFNDWNTSGEEDRALRLAKQFDLHKTFLSTLAYALPPIRPCTLSARDHRKNAGNSLGRRWTV